MVTISHVVKKLIRDKPFLQEALAQEIISYGNLAKKLIPEIELELEHEVKHSAVVMALRRYAEKLKQSYRDAKPFNYKSEIIMKTNLCDIAVLKSPKLLAKLKSLYNLVDFEKGDTLNIIVGNYEVTIITNEKHKKHILMFLKNEKILNIESNLVAFTMRFSDDFLHTPGVIFAIIRRLAWENINILEIVSTLTELTLILTNKDSMKAHKVLQASLRSE